MIEGGELSVAQAVAAGETCLEAVCRIAYLMRNKSSSSSMDVVGCCLIVTHYCRRTNRCRPMVVASAAFVMFPPDSSNKGRRY